MTFEIDGKVIDFDLDKALEEEENERNTEA